MKPEGIRFPPIETLREFETYAYQAAYYVVQNEKLAVEVAAEALTDVLLSGAGDAPEAVGKHQVKRAVVARLIPVIGSASAESRSD